MAEKKVQLSKKDRLSVALRSTFLQGSWNYERMQNGGWCFAMIPAIKKLYTTKEDQIAASKISDSKTVIGISNNLALFSMICRFISLYPGSMTKNTRSKWNLLWRFNS